MPMAQGAYEHRDRAESFGRIAGQYDDARPTYPDAMIVDLATSGGVDVLDVGCGTGIASRLLATRGMRVLGVEIDAGMADVARAGGTEVEVSSFEDWDDAGRRFDLLTAAQAWHWVEPIAGAAKAATVLRPGGGIALFWNITDHDPQLADAMDEVYQREAPQLLKRGRRRQGEPATDVLLDTLRGAGFVGLEQREYPWQHRYDRAAWLRLIATYSDHHLLPDEQRARLLDGVGEMIQRRGGSITARYETSLVRGRTPDASA